MSRMLSTGSLWIRKKFVFTCSGVPRVAKVEIF
jgi:hypothetical protein